MSINEQDPKANEPTTHEEVEGHYKMVKPAEQPAEVEAHFLEAPDVEGHHWGIRPVEQPEVEAHHAGLGKPSEQPEVEAHNARINGDSAEKSE
jgi:hypothetical protein